MPAEKKVKPVKGKKATATKSSPAKKTTASKPAKKLATAEKAYTKTEIFKTIADHTGISKKQVQHVFAVLNELIEAHVGKKGSAGTFKIPGLLMIKVVQKPATKARKGINPFTGEPTTFKAKPARKVVKIKALKSLKDMVA